MTPNAELSAIFNRMAQLLELVGANRFRLIAFQRAGRALEALTDDVAELVGTDRPGNVAALTAIEGIGKGLAEKIVEYLTTQRIAEYEELLERIPGGLIDLLEIPGLGPKTIALMWNQCEIESLDDLKQALQSDALADLPGLGKKKLDNLRKSIEFAESTGDRVRIARAMPLACWFIEQLSPLEAVKQIAFAGSLRRGRETIGDIDLLVAAKEPDAAAISNAFVELEPITDVLVKGPTKTSVRVENGLQVDLRIIRPDQYGAALMYFTGSKEHNIRMRARAIRQGMRLNEYGLVKGDTTVACETEEEVFKALGLVWIPPELREDRGEIALAAKNELPALIKLADIKAELHAHTTASDGKWSIRELAAAAAERGFHTVAVTDHSKGQGQANGLTNERLEEHIVDIHAVADEMKSLITILAGTEVDILADGTLDYPNSLLKELDVVVASPHAALSQDPKKATERLLKAIRNPYITILGHPTGRLVLRREGLSPDMKQLIAAAAERGIAMEINANAARLDLRDTHARSALEAGVKLSINTDAHSQGHLDQLIYGVLTARRAGARKQDVINCLSQAKMTRWLASTRA